MNSYDIGDAVVLRVEFRDGRTKGLVDPNTVTCFVKQVGGGAAVEAPTTRESLGVYTATVDLTATGTFSYRFQGTGGATGSEEGRFRVRPRRVTG